MEDLQKLYPEVMSNLPISRMKEATLEKKLVYFLKALNSVGDSWKSHQRMEDTDVKQVIVMVLATLDFIIKTATELFDIKEDYFSAESLSQLDFITDASRNDGDLGKDSHSASLVKPLKFEFEATQSSGCFLEQKNGTVEELEAGDKAAMSKSTMNEISTERGKGDRIGKENAPVVPSKGSMQSVCTLPPAPPPVFSKGSLRSIPPPAPPVPSKVSTLSVSLPHPVPSEAPKKLVLSAPLVPSKGSIESTQPPTPPPPPPPSMPSKGPLLSVPQPPSPPPMPSQVPILSIPPPPPPPMPSKGLMLSVPPPSPPSMPPKGHILSVPLPPPPPPVPSKKTMLPVPPPPPPPPPAPSKGPMQSVAPPPPPMPSKRQMQSAPAPAPPPPVPLKAPIQSVSPTPPPLPPKGQMQSVTPAPPHTLSKGLVPTPIPPLEKDPGLPPPPPPSLGGVRSLNRKGATTKLRRSAQMATLFRDLKGKMEGKSSANNSGQGRKKQLGGSPGGKQGLSASLAEMKKRSSYFQQIEEDLKKHSKTIMELKAVISSFKAKDMAMLVKFQKRVDSFLEGLTDESQVLKSFEDFPTKKLEALRAASALYSKLDMVVINLKNWEILPPLEKLLNKFDCYFTKVKVEVEALERIKDEEAKKFKSQNIDFDINKILTLIKEHMIDVSSSCLELALKERREAKAAAMVNGKIGSKSDGKTSGSVKILWRAFQVAFRVYSFAGGQDDRANKLTRELANEILTDSPNP